MTLWLTRLKRTVAAVIQSRPIGNAIGCIYGDVIPFHGMPIDVKGTGIPAANKASLWWGIYESAEFRFIEKFLRPDLPVIELGSSVGAISSVIARRLADGQRLTCVEANPRLIPALRRNVKRHACHLDTDVINAAVFYEEGTVRFGLSTNNLTSRVAVTSAVEAAVVPSVTLAEIGARNPDVPFQLVADIEGAELSILLHDAAGLQYCKIMIIELHETVLDGKPHTVSELQCLLADRGFLLVAHYGNVFVYSRASGGASGARCC